MLLDMNDITCYISENIYNNVSPENVLLGVIDKFEIPFGYENVFAVNSIRQIIVYHITQKVNSDLTKLATEKSIQFEKKRREGI